MDLLTSHFTFLGIDFQWWTPIVGGALALYVLAPVERLNAPSRRPPL
jgi:hypothetical protein